MAFPWDLAAPNPRGRSERYDPELEFYFGRADPRAKIASNSRGPSREGTSGARQRAESHRPGCDAAELRAVCSDRPGRRDDGPGRSLGDEAQGSQEARAIGGGGAASTSLLERPPRVPPDAAPDKTAVCTNEEGVARRRSRSGTTPASPDCGKEAAARRRPQSSRASLASATSSAANSPRALGELSAKRIRAMIPEELRAVCKARSLPATGSTSEMRGRLMALLPKRKPCAGAPRSVVDAINPGYRPSRQHLTAADSAHARGGSGTAATGAAAARARLARPVAIAQLSLQDIRHRATTSLDFLRGGKIAVLLFWATGVGGGVDPSAKKWSGSAIPHDP